MPTVSARPTSDILDSLINDSSSPVFDDASHELGIVVALKSTASYGYMGRFELPIPDGATIDGVRITFTSAGSGVSSALTRNFALGFVDDDSTWPEDGFTSTDDYATRSALPWPWRWSGSVVVDNQGAWFGDSDPVDIAFTLSAISTNDPYRFADSITPREVEASGLVDNLQDWLDGTGGTLRADTASGTDLPICFAIVANAAGNSWQFVYSADTGTESRRPLLEVEYTAAPASGTITASSSAGPAVSARPTVAASVLASASAAPSVSGRATLAPAVSASATVGPATDARATVE
jgi:hypothetical protein